MISHNVALLHVARCRWCMRRLVNTLLELAAEQSDVSRDNHAVGEIPTTIDGVYPTDRAFSSAPLLKRGREPAAGVSRD